MMTFKEKIRLRLEQARDDFWTFIAYVADRMEAERYEPIDPDDDFSSYGYEDIDLDTDSNYITDADLDDEFDHPHSDHNHSTTFYDDDSSMFDDEYPHDR